MKNKNPQMNAKLSNMGQASAKLARLLSGERLTVEHGNFRTASFAPSNRHIRLPIFKEMSDAMYFLFVSHEVGHALYTPADGWHHADTEIPGCPRSYINIVEDIRIEKLIRRKYQGLYKEFFAGYADLLARDFFGIQGYDISKFGFMNRLNIFSKCEGLITVPFSEDEQKLVDLAMSVETWEDVIKVCRLLKEEVQKLPPMSQQGDNDGKSENDSDQDTSSSDSESDEESSDTAESKSGDENSEDEASDSSGQDDEEGSGDEDGEGSGGGENEGDTDGENPGRGQTLGGTPKPDKRTQHDDTSVDEHYRKNEEALVDTNSTFVDVTHPLVKSNVVDGIKRSTETSGYTQFVQKNNVLISKMVNEFNLRKAARRERRSQEAKTGSLDPLKLFDYKFNEDIFLRHQQNPDEQNHGVVMFLDCSQSMSGSRWRAISNQAALMSEFYSRVGIKFRVYTWTSQGFRWEAKIDLILCNSWPKQLYRKGMHRLISTTGWIYWGGTPMGDTYIKMGSYALDLKETYHLDKVHLILMTDGPSWAAGLARLDLKTNSVYVKLKHKTIHSSSTKPMLVHQHLTNVYRQIFDSVGYYVVDANYHDMDPVTTKTLIKDQICVYEPIDFSYVVTAPSTYISSALNGGKPREFKKFLEIFVRHIA